MNSTSEHELVERCRQGDENAFRELVDAYKGLVFGLIARSVTNRARAEELAQDVFLKVHKGLRYFRGEYMAHIHDRRCPAHRCRELITFEIDPVLCNGCGACVQICSGKAILGEKKKPHIITQAQCTKCGACLEMCKFDAVLVH